MDWSVRTINFCLFVGPHHRASTIVPFNLEEKMREEEEGRVEEELEEEDENEEGRRRRSRGRMISIGISRFCVFLFFFVLPIYNYLSYFIN